MNRNSRIGGLSILLALAIALGWGVWGAAQWIIERRF